MDDVGHRTAADREEGVTLPEVLVAAFLVVVALGAVAATAGQVLASITTVQLRTRAVAVATSSLEAARDLDFADLATGVADPPGSGLWDPDGAGPLGIEVLVVDAAGGVTGAVHHGSGDGLVWSTAVTWVDVPGVGADSGSDEDAKRITVEVTWQRGGTDGAVVQSTIVADVAR